MKKSLIITAIAFAFMLILNACGRNGEKTPTTTEPIQTQPTAPAQPEVSNVITIEGDDKMMFNKSVLRVAAGETITLTLKHSGKLDKNAMGHNFVVLTKGTDMNAFAKKAMSAKNNDYIPPSESASIIAYTKLLGGGESDTITFKITEKGSYDFLCSFPGHVALMKGKLIVV